MEHARSIHSSSTGSHHDSLDDLSESDHQLNSHISTITSPSSQSSESSPRPTSRWNGTLSREALTLLSDLSNFLSVGCYVFEDLFLHRKDYNTDTWGDVTRVPQLGAKENDRYAYVQDLVAAGWVRLQLKRSKVDPHFQIYRVYLLPFDVGHRFIDRNNKRLYSALETLLTDINTSTVAWEGDFVQEKVTRFDRWATQDEGSLFYMFNKIPSPSPKIDSVKEKYAREALEDLLDPASVLPGLKTKLYPYQRRSAGLMLQREAVPSLHLDPRLEPRTAPNGSTYFYSPRDFVFSRHPKYYEACKGGILAETMGLGKTVICLSLIIATKYHLPSIPPEYSMPPVRAAVASLADMAVSAINRGSVAYQVEFDRIKHASGEEMDSCRQRLRQNPACYEIPQIPKRWQRKTILPPPKTMLLAPTTIVVVPQNLCRQWQSEISKHLDDSVLRLLVMDDRKTELPPAIDLRSYDIILFTRGRFEMESRDGSDDQGRRLGTTQRDCRCPYIGATRTRDCTCLRTDDLYHSPLKSLKIKRLIIDEGHFFANSNSNAVTVANNLITADHRWVVSGTPAKDLLGVEVDMSAAESVCDVPNSKISRDNVLNKRRHFSKKDDTEGAVKNIGSLAANFLKIKPWCADELDDRRADWEEYVYRHESSRSRTFSGFSTCLRRTLESIVLRTRPEDVEKDIDLPPLRRRVVRLDPSFYDKLTANLFTLVLTANAITSERTDQDYLWHKNSRKARSHLISNLRQSAFFWTGFSEADVLASVKSSDGYLAKEGTGSTESDRDLLAETLKCADTIIESAGWKSLSRSHELGLFVDGWPSESAEHWSFDESRNPLLTGLSQLLEAQKHVNQRADQDNPGEGLAGAGIRSVAPTKHANVKKEDEDDESRKDRVEKPILTKSGIPSSSIDGEPVLKRRDSIGARGLKISPKRKASTPFEVDRPQKKRRKSKGTDADQPSTPRSDAAFEPSQTPTTEPRIENGILLPPTSPISQSRIVGTTSAKLSYLMSQIIKYHQAEKILVFYDGDNAAYYIAQMLELLHIKHEIYAKSLASKLKSEYVVRFNEQERDSVLLMDIRNAAYGLNISAASRIFFVNPVHRPDIEAQAIKRAHRIGQRREVHVETLVLKGTIEEKMLERSEKMSVSEHHHAKALEDDGRIRDIIQNARVLTVGEDEKEGHGQMARLEEPQQLWGRPGWQAFSGAGLLSRATISKKKKSAADAQRFDDNGSPLQTPNSVKRTLDFVDCTCTDAPRMKNPVESEDDEPLLVTAARRRASIAMEDILISSHTLDAASPATDHACSLETRKVDMQRAAQTSQSRSQFRRVPVSQLLNEGSPSKQQQQQAPVASPELTRDILPLL